jgi:hypothetical protein
VGELAKGDPSPPMLGSLEAKALIINIIATIDHLVLIPNLELDSYFYSFDPTFSIHRSMMMLFASMCE